MVEVVLLGIVAPAALALIVAAVAWRIWRAPRAPSAGRWGGVAACLAAWIVAYLLVNRAPPGIPPAERWQWLFLVGIAAGVIGLVAAAAAPRRWPILPLAGVLGATTLILPVTPDDGAEWVWKAGAAAGAATLFALLELLSRRRPGPALAFAMAIAAGAGAAVVMLSGSDRLFRLLAALAGALAAIAVAGWRRPEVCPGPGTTAIFAALLVGTVLTGQFYSYSDVPVSSYLIACLAPLAVWAAELPPVHRARPWIAAAARLAAVVVLAAIAVALAVAVSDTELYYG